MVRIEALAWRACRTTCGAPRLRGLVARRPRLFPRTRHRLDPDAGQALLVLAQQLSPDVVEFHAVRVDAWTFAERAVEGLFDRYAAAERAVAAEAAADRARRLGKVGACPPVARATERRPS